MCPLNGLGTAKIVSIRIRADWTGRCASSRFLLPNFIRIEAAFARFASARRTELSRQTSDRSVRSWADETTERLATSRVRAGPGLRVELGDEVIVAGKRPWAESEEDR